MSGPIFLMQPKGITYSQSVPKKPQILPGPGITIASTSPVQILISTSTTHPSLLPLQILTTSLSRSSQILIPVLPQFTAPAHTEYSGIHTAYIQQYAAYPRKALFSYLQYMTLPADCAPPVFPFSFLFRCTTIRMSADPQRSMLKKKFKENDLL